MLQAMANDAKHLALPSTHAVFVSLKKVNGFPNVFCFALASPLYFITLTLIGSY
jgi:hypothetical protein